MLSLGSITIEDIVWAERLFTLANIWLLARVSWCIWKSNELAYAAQRVVLIVIIFGSAAWLHLAFIDHLNSKAPIVSLSDFELRRALNRFALPPYSVGRLSIQPLTVQSRIPIQIRLVAEDSNLPQRNMLTRALRDSLNTIQTKCDLLLRFPLAPPYILTAEAFSSEEQPPIIGPLALCTLDRKYPYYEVSATGEEVERFIRECVIKHAAQIDRYIDNALTALKAGPVK
jgi:hypothetical protein